MDRKKIIAMGLDLSTRGLEIGAGYSPLFDLFEAPLVEFLDHGDTQAIKNKYDGMGVDTSRVPHIHYVWSGQSLHETVKKQHFDWIIASHVIEHAPNLVSFLNDCANILSDNGTLSLAIPDMRYCFDRFRGLTTIDEVINAHISGCTTHSTGHRVSAALYYARCNELFAWGPSPHKKYKIIGNTERAKKELENISNEYIDCHAWRFTPSSFKLIIYELQSLGLINIGIHHFHDTVGCEFFAQLKKVPLETLDRLTMLEQVHHEMYGLEIKPSLHAKIRGNIFRALRKLAGK